MQEAPIGPRTGMHDSHFICIEHFVHSIGVEPFDYVDKDPAVTHLNEIRNHTLGIGIR